MTRIDMNGKPWIDLTALGVLISTLADMLPSIAALFTIVWAAMRIYVLGANIWGWKLPARFSAECAKTCPILTARNNE